MIERLELNGTPAAALDVAACAQNNYAHFTVMPVRDGRVCGLDLHLQRLQQGTRELFADDLDVDRVCAWLRHALRDVGDATLRVTVFSRAFDRARPGATAPPDVLIALTPASVADASPLRLKSFRYARELPTVKHVGTFALFHHRHLAQQAGFDDAVFVDTKGRVAEASVWNIGFLDGTSVVWPQAPQLAGVGMLLLQAGLDRLGVAQTTRPLRLDELPGMRAAFVCNANTVARPVTAIDAVALPLDSQLIDTLQRAHATQPWQLP